LLVNLVESIEREIVGWVGVVIHHFDTLWEYLAYILRDYASHNHVVDSAYFQPLISVSIIS